MSNKNEISMKELVKFVDDNYRPITWKDALQAYKLIPVMAIVIIILLVYLIGLAFFTPITIANHVALGMSFVALGIAVLSVTRVLKREIQASFTRLRVESMYPNLNQKDERTKYLLYAVVFMKITNQNLKLTVLYEIDKSLFKREKLLARLYEV